MATYRTAETQVFPAANSTANTIAQEAIGNKSDTTSTAIGTTKSLMAYSKGAIAKLLEIAKHLHHNERWYGVAELQIAETDIADRIGVDVDPFTLDAGDDDWGAWVQILGSSDTPAESPNVSFDLNELQFTANERAGTYFLQIGYGTSGAQAIADKTFTEKVVTFDGANNEKFVTVTTERITAGTKVWARTLCPGQNTGTIKFYFGLHEYLG
jgi:hypothetical protein